jgi:hypothetical protein
VPPMAPMAGLPCEDTTTPEVHIPTDLYNRFLEAGRLARLRGQHQRMHAYSSTRIVRSEI